MKLIYYPNKFLEQEVKDVDLENPGFDPKDQYIGLTTPLDKIYNQSYNGVSPNPMDTNWGGAEFTENLVNKGYYADNEVQIRVAS
jgi:hypothetical protein